MKRTYLLLPITLLCMSFLLLCSCGKSDVKDSAWLPEEYADQSVASWNLITKEKEITKILYRVQNGEKGMLQVSYSPEADTLEKTSATLIKADTALKLSDLQTAAKKLLSWAEETEPYRAAKGLELAYIAPQFVFESGTDPFKTEGIVGVAAYSLKDGSVSVLKDGYDGSKAYGAITVFFDKNGGAWQVLIDD